MKLKYVDSGLNILTNMKIIIYPLLHVEDLFYYAKNVPPPRVSLVCFFSRKKNKKKGFLSTLYVTLFVTY